MAVTVQEIAEKLQLSKSTVSKALNNASDVNENTRKKVIDEAIRMGYNIKNLKTQAQKRLCIFIENMDYDSVEQFAYEIILGFKTEALENNYEVDVVPFTMNEKPKYKYDNFMREKNYCGGFLLGFSFHDQFVQQLNNTIYPTVLLDNYIDNEHVAWIGTDSYEGIQKAVGYLLELGHRKIALLNGGYNSRVSHERLFSYQAAMAGYHLPISDELIGRGDYTENCAEKIVPQFLKNNVTAIVCANDRMAFGVIRELRKLGKSVPEDISVIGYDDLPLASYTFPALTTIHQSRLELGKGAFFVLQKMFSGIPINKILLKPKLIIRDSAAPINPEQK